MADYFTNFSLVVPLKPVQREYALSLASLAQSHRFEETPSPGLPIELAVCLEGWAFETELRPEGIWLHSYEGGVDAACIFIQHLLRKFDPSGSVGFEWSCDCSKPRTDAYGGGAAYITANEIKSFSTSDWLRSVEA